MTLWASKARPSRPSAVIFDLDGTLVDSAGDIAAALNEVLGIRRLPPYSTSEVTRFIGNGISALVHRAFLERGISLDADELSTQATVFQMAYNSCLTNSTKAYDGVVEAVSALRDRGTLTGICTNKEEGLALRIVNRLGLWEYFDVVIGGTSGRLPKPSPDPLLEAIARLGILRENTIMVGDSATDLNCARNAGVPFIGVTFGYSPAEMTVLGPDASIESYVNLGEACVALWSRLP